MSKPWQPIPSVYFPRGIIRLKKIIRCSKSWPAKRAPQWHLLYAVWPTNQGVCNEILTAQFHWHEQWPAVTKPEFKPFATAPLTCWRTAQSQTRSLLSEYYVDVYQWYIWCRGSNVRVYALSSHNSLYHWPNVVCSCLCLVCSGFLCPGQDLHHFFLGAKKHVSCGVYFYWTILNQCLKSNRRVNQTNILCGKKKKKNRHSCQASHANVATSD